MLALLEAPLTARVDWRKCVFLESCTQQYALHTLVNSLLSVLMQATLTQLSESHMKRDVKTGGDLVEKKKGFPGRRKRNEPG